MDRAPYRHTQTGWTILGICTAIALAIAAAPNQRGIGLVVLAVVTALFCSLTVVVDDAAVAIRFGPGLIRRAFPLDRVAACARVRTGFGWGIRYGMCGRGGVTLYNVSGFDAIELVMTDGSRRRIGTDDPAGLERAIRERLTPRP